MTTKFRLAEKTSENSCKILKNLTFKRFESACKIAARLSTIHKGTEYIIIDLETKEQFSITPLL